MKLFLYHMLSEVHFMIKYSNPLKIVQILLSDFHSMFRIIVFWFHICHWGLVFHGRLLDSILHTPIKIIWFFKENKNTWLQLRHIRHGNIKKIPKLMNTGQIPWITMFITRWRPSQDIQCVYERSHLRAPQNGHKTLSTNFDDF